MGRDSSKGEVPEVVGRLMDIRPSPRFPTNPLYEIHRDDGSVVAIAGTTTINNHLHKTDIGRRVRLLYRGEATSSSGTVYRDIGVDVEEDDDDSAAVGPGCRNKPALSDRLAVEDAGVKENGNDIPLPESTQDDGPSDDLPF